MDSKLFLKCPVRLVQGMEAHLFYAVSRRACWWQGEGGMHWACGGDIWMQRLSSGSAAWTSPKVCSHSHASRWPTALCRHKHLLPA